MNYGRGIPYYSLQFIQYAAYNVDLKTQDGNNTFHGMGIISTTTLGIKKCIPIFRVKFTSTDIAGIG